MNRVLLLVALLHINIGLLLASSEVSLMLQNVATGMHQIRLPDGKSLFGDTTAVMGSGSFDLVHLDDDSTSAFRTSSDLIAILRHPIKARSWMHTECYTPKEVIDYFIKITDSARHCNVSALQILWHFLRDGNIHGVFLPGLKPQPERAALFKELYEWRIGMRPDAEHAIEVLRIERKRTEDIAAEEKRASEMAAKADGNASDTSGLRRRHVPQPQKAEDDSRSTEKDPLVLRPIRAH